MQFQYHDYGECRKRFGLLKLIVVFLSLRCRRATTELPIGRGVGKTLPDVRDAGQKDRLVPVPRIGAEDEFVHMFHETYE